MDKEKLKTVKDSLKKEIKKLRASGIGSGILGVGSLAIIVLNFFLGLLLFNTVGGLGFFATLGAYGLSKAFSSSQKVNKLGKVGEHLDKIGSKGVKATKELNKKRDARIKEYQGLLGKVRSKLEKIDLAQAITMALSVAFMLLFRTSPLALVLPLVMTISAIPKLKLGNDEADLDARIRCISSDKEFGEVKTPAKTESKEEVKTKTETKTPVKSYSKDYSYTAPSTPEIVKPKVYRR